MPAIDGVLQVRTQRSRRTSKKVESCQGLPLLSKRPLKTPAGGCQRHSGFARKVLKHEEPLMFDKIN